MYFKITLRRSVKAIAALFQVIAHFSAKLHWKLQWKQSLPEWAEDWRCTVMLYICICFCCIFHCNANYSESHCCMPERTIAIALQILLCNVYYIIYCTARCTKHCLCYSAYISVTAAHCIMKSESRWKGSKHLLLLLQGQETTVAENHNTLHNALHCIANFKMHMVHCALHNILRATLVNRLLWVTTVAEKQLPGHSRHSDTIGESRRRR